ncbi:MULTISPECIES: helix-turn-helix domain-containing protein [Sulfurospirillum]|uniref:HTH_XRE superfamily n=4 Tax=Sulfurospirillum TaxID=57665 RepID=A0A1Y0HL23_9BACT|nr:MULTISPECIES: helix-turn-helix transcriptional regulator [Sulfurospirillum]AHJ12844.1 HTH_XRE superfamily [Sulfurospirillum multivorans DSM 12446]AOO65320.1 HTH_XRE superfamily [Sulfurospirillum halorespirans DSM 13726]ARU48801.1 hypothetical protein Sdiek1_1638 [Sulfurospirillum diekertiae]ASC93622.1 hypothetical protein Sdiek2_1604 [Sulfurospirillum diekertiae]ATB69666.1 HTH_XRE superfamily [Sulfurospirillum diekertiae]
MEREKLNTLFKHAGLSKKEFAQKLSMNYQSVNQWESTQNAPLWVWSWLENYAKARKFDEMMALGKSMEEGKR